MNAHRSLASVAGLTMLISANSVLADKRQYRDDGDFYDHAKVVSVSPVYQEVPVRRTVQECVEQPHHRRPARRTYTPEILGGVVGGVVGNQFGRGRGRTVLTVAGAVLGASVGHDINVRMHDRGNDWRRMETQCFTRQQVHMERELIHYRVEYRYRGQQFVTRMAEHPGDRMRVKVGVTPAGAPDHSVAVSHEDDDCRNCKNGTYF